MMAGSFPRSLYLGVGVVLLAGLVGLSNGADTPKAKDGNDNKNTKDKNEKSDPGAAKYLNQLRAVFAAWDANNDGNADRDELARVCRGASAKAFELDGDPRKLEPLGDYQLFKLLDSNKDWSISKKEFETWAKGHAEQLAAQEDALEKYIQKQKQLAKTDMKAKNYEKLKAELKKDNEQLERMQDKLKAAQKHIQNMKRDNDKNDNKNDKNKNDNNKNKNKGKN